MTEEFLHYIWKFRLFDQESLTTTVGEDVSIIHPGTHNFDSGPDFFNAKIRIGKTLWSGNIEIHVNLSDWIKHKHQNDQAYSNVILHVVYDCDQDAQSKKVKLIPTLLLKGKFKESIYQQYLNFKISKHWIPCEKLISTVNLITINSWLDRVLVERLERKSQSITDSLKLNKNNWEETFYHQLARSFGMKINADPFELLAKSLPINVLAKHKNSQKQLEALLFGQAGMLNGIFVDDYPNELKKEYSFLKQKFNLKSIDTHLWKFLRLRPVNFPTIRIAQFANLIYKSSHLFSKIMETNDVKSLKKFLLVDSSDYWDTHYQFDKKSIKRRKSIGSDTIDIVIINTIVPFLFVYGKRKREEVYSDKALLFLTQVSGEKNSVIKKWEKLKQQVKTAYSTQALLQLKREYCDKKKCLQCAVGLKLISK